LIATWPVFVSNGKIAQNFASFLMDGSLVPVNHHDRTSILLFLPCDWRFLPKLGPLCLAGTRAFFVNNGFGEACHAISGELTRKHVISCANILCVAAILRESIV